MIPRFFIDRPVFAIVLSLVFVLAGGVAVFTLPVAQYPEVTPPTVLVTAVYPGANAMTVRDTVAAPIEEQVSGVENMLYMSSTSTNDGTYNLTVTFRLGMDTDMAQVLVQNRGITVKKMSPNTMMIVNLVSPDGRYDSNFLSNYATIYIKDELGRLDGVAGITLKAGSDYSPSQNPAGDAGSQSSQGSQLSTTSPTGPQPQAVGIVRLRDVARVELGSRQYDQSCTLDGKPSVAVSIYQLPGSNALNTAAGVYAKMRELRTRFPDGLEYRIVYDTTPFIRESVNEVFNTLRDATILVGIVVLVFLQDWKAMILPMIDVPVSLIGTFAIMAAMGFSLNNLTLFGLVLAIGIVVDDAIVVLENIERLIATGLDARTATIKAMGEITGPILAITLVLSSVFIPCCFLGGISGQFFRQFAVTIAVSTIISAVNALTMTPSRAVLIFKTEQGAHGHEFKREALPWWIFSVVGGILAVWYAPAFLKGKFDLPAEWTGTGPSEATGLAYWTITAAYFA